MTLAEAHKTLNAGPLKFGDPAQIEAVNYIATVEGVAGKLKACKHDSGVCSKCDGMGTCSHCGAECDECDASGYVADCECVRGVPVEVMREAEEVNRKRKQEADKAEVAAWI